MEASSGQRPNINPSDLQASIAKMQQNLKSIERQTEIGPTQLLDLRDKIEVIGKQAAVFRQESSGWSTLKANGLVSKWKDLDTSLKDKIRERKTEKMDKTVFKQDLLDESGDLFSPRNMSEESQQLYEDVVTAIPLHRIKDFDTAY